MEPTPARASIVTVTMNPSIDISTSIDRILPIRKLRCSQATRHPGGGGINVARVARRFGADAIAIYSAGGSPGRLLHQLLELEGIASIAHWIEGETREDFTVLEESSGQQFRFVLPGPRLAEAEWRHVLDQIATLDPPEFIIASGSLPPGVPDDFYARLAELCRELGSRFVLDGSGPALALALEAKPYLVKPNLREMIELCGRELGSEADYCQAAAALVAAGKAEIVTLTLGEKGAILATRDGVWRAPGLPLKVLSAIGAGDAFLGALMAAIVRQLPLDEAFRIAVAASSATLLMSGTTLCTRADAEGLYSKIEVRRI